MVFEVLKTLVDALAYGCLGVAIWRRLPKWTAWLKDNANAAKKKVNTLLGTD